MKKQHKRCLLASTIACSLMLTNTAQADFIGFGEITLGHSDASDPERDGNSAGFYEISGAIATPVGSRGTAILDAEYRQDEHSGDIIDDDDMDDQYQIGIHYLHDFSGNKFGAFIAHGGATHDSNNEDYKATFGGIEAILSLDADTLVYGQLGVGDADNDSESSSGFEDGSFARIGLGFTGFGSTLLKLELEKGSSDEYEDEDERGKFTSVSLTGETSFGASKNLAVTYGVSRGTFDASNDDNKIQENSIFVGFRYYFGGTNSKAAFKSGLIGLPTIPTRAMSWTPGLD